MPRYPAQGLQQFHVFAGEEIALRPSCPSPARQRFSAARGRECNSSDPACAMASCAPGSLARNLVRVVEEQVSGRRFRPRRAQEAQIQPAGRVIPTDFATGRTVRSSPAERKIAMRSTSSVRDKPIHHRRRASRSDRFPNSVRGRIRSTCGDSHTPSGRTSWSTRS